ncbi:AlkA N-terminal domain-containing protein [Isoptericola aurantiacus]|uniref:AlkA N-terminal domain-containing protein n=1 Tax=Isoptericola aurantiacus TaxID=3377839 RepID=UPI00383A2613
MTTTAPIATEPRRARRPAPVRPGPADAAFTERYRAIAARDTRFDGQFVTAVRSTGIYCRPSCPARTPKPENVTFFLTGAAAHDAGYRACKRCLPEATPGTPAWDLRGDVTGRAMRLVTDGVVDREGVDGLARRLGYSPRHLHRLLRDELGAGPLALARAHRAQTARTLLTGTDLSVADVAFAAGFGSIRQLNDTVRAVFATTPTELRSRRQGGSRDGAHRVAGGSTVRPSGVPHGDGAGPTPEGPVRLDVTLPVREPFDARGTVAFLAARAVEGVETANLRDPDVVRYARTLRLPHGPGAVELRAGAGVGPGRVALHLELAALQDVATAVARVRRLLDLDADPVAVDETLGTDPVLGPLVRATPGLRMPGTVDPHELVTRAIVGQQIAVAAARTHLSRLTASAGEPYTGGIVGLSRLFPTADRTADAAPTVRLPSRQRAALGAVARALADGDLLVDVAQDAEALSAALTAFRGIGPWTAAYVRMRVLGDPDVWLPGDAALRPCTPDDAAAWAPWRSYAVGHLWRRTTRTERTAP